MNTDPLKKSLHEIQAILDRYNITIDTDKLLSRESMQKFLKDSHYLKNTPSDFHR